MNQDMWDFHGRLVAEEKALAQRARGFVAAYVLASTLVYVPLDVYAYDKDSVYSLVNMLMWGVGYFLFLGVMHSGGLTPEGTKTGIGTYFVMGLVVGLFVGMALILLVIPGLYLLMRWLPAYSRALVSHDGVGGAMRWSWERTDKWQRPLALGLIPPVLLIGFSILSGLAFYSFGEDLGWTEYVLASIVWNGAYAVGLAWLTVYGAAAYALISGAVEADDLEPLSGEGLQS